MVNDSSLLRLTREIKAGVRPDLERGGAIRHATSVHTPLATSASFAGDEQAGLSAHWLPPVILVVERARFVGIVAGAVDCEKNRRMDQIGARAYGVALVTIAAVLWSTGPLFVRLLDLDVWTVLVWRSLFAALSLALVVGVQNGRHTIRSVRAIGRPGLVAIPLAAVGMGCYVIAVKLTTVANVMVVYATVPFVAAGVALLWTGERAASRVLLASAIALVGILIMAGTATRPRDIAGNAVAFLMTLAFGTQLVMARRYPWLEMASINAIAAALCALICLPLATVVAPSPLQLVILALFGATNTALAFLLFLKGGRYIPSGEAGLIGLIDVVLSPFWVWLAFAEQPGQAATIGGGLVLASVLWYLAGQRRIKPVHNP
jgi:drug/metabolite transporter (DMT)-like permease